MNDEGFTILGNEGDHLDLYFYMFNLRSHVGRLYVHWRTKTKIGIANIDVNMDRIPLS